MSFRRAPGSFRDPVGHVVERGDEVLRVVREEGTVLLDLLMASGLYDRLVADGLLVPHTEEDPSEWKAEGAARVLRHPRIPFVSHPYEWSPAALRDAALATLRIQRTALECGMTLKDASAFNVQLVDGRAVWIDTLSFEPYVEGSPWTGYRQFCRHFLAPLALACRADPRLLRLLRADVDGIPVDLAWRMLPWGARFRPGLAVHLGAHAAAERAAGREGRRGGRVSKQGLLGIVDSLERTVRRLRPSRRSAWTGYYAACSIERDDFDVKVGIVRRRLGELSGGVAWDLGSNEGVFSELAASLGYRVVAMDSDPAVVDSLWSRVAASRLAVTPLVVDLVNPPGPTGFANEERRGLLERGPADVVLALALVHHLAIRNGVPLDRIVDFLARSGRAALVEFVPPEDAQAAAMLRARTGPAHPYDRATFENAVARRFEVLARDAVGASGRILYTLRGAQR